MATTEIVSWRQEDKDVGLRTTEPSRGLITFIICTMMLTALCILQAVIWRDSLPQVPPYQFGNRTIARLRRPKLQFGSLARDAAWEFRPEAMAKVRTSTLKLHPDVHLVLYKTCVPISEQENGKRDPYHWTGDRSDDDNVL
ncbi:uncharacterized protein LOC144873334 isoform X2 [Branchiostoma floridae x Branchiostoma japonicum]